MHSGNEEEGQGGTGAGGGEGYVWIRSIVWTLSIDSSWALSV
jgi:hypothetical protein